MTSMHVTGLEPKRLPQFILAVDAAYYHSDNVQLKAQQRSAFSQPINYFPHEFFCENAQSYLTIREREYLDESLSYTIDIVNGEEIISYTLNFKEEKKKGDPRYKQLLPYMIARQLQDDGTYLYFPYRRTKKVGEQRLAGNGSLGYGGHIDLEDIVSTNSVIDLQATILKSALREAKEEFTAYKGDQILNRDTYFNYVSFGDLFIVDNSNDVGELHLGIVMYFDVPAGYVLQASEDELAKLSPMTAEQMLNDPTFNAENWTRLYLEHVAKSTFQEGNGGDDPNADFDIDEPGLEAEQAGDSGEDDISDTEDPAVLAIDHGGEKVGEADAALVALSLSEQLNTQVERIQLHVQMAEDEPDPQKIVEEVIESETNKFLGVDPAGANLES